MTPQPSAAHAWLDPDRVRRWVGIDSSADQADNVDHARAAAAAYVERVRPDLFRPGSLEVPDDVVQGAVLLAARWAARRSSPAGLASFAEFGAVAVQRLDVDVQRLLGVGRYAAPVVG